MIGAIPKILHDDTGRGKPVVLTDDLRRFLLANDKEPRSAVARALGLNRKAITRLYDSLGAKRETKKQRAVRKTAEQIVNAMQREEIKDQKEKQRKVQSAARELVRSGKNILDRLQESVKGKDGQPINYNGEELSTEAMMDISLINMGKDNPQANLYVRAQAMAVKAREEEEELKRKSKALMKTLTTKMAARKRRMRQALESYGLWSGMMETTLDSWADAYMALEVAKMQWREKGMPNVETHITAQAQVQNMPSQYKEAVNRAQKIFNECNQKLSTDLSKYQRMTGRSEEDNSFLSEMMEGLNKIGD